jgi:hypothetical protein
MSDVLTDRKRRRISADSWASLSAAIARQHNAVAEVDPKSPRIVPTLQKLRFLDQTESQSHV